MAEDSVSGEQLKSFIERIERLEEEKKELMEQIRDVFKEAKSSGFETRVMRQVLRLRRMQEHDRLEEQELLDLYKQALGMR
jgi:uncharacterized protein (UPF0335 family)